MEPILKTSSLNLFSAESTFDCRETLKFRGLTIVHSTGEVFMRRLKTFKFLSYSPQPKDTEVDIYNWIELF